MSANYLIDSILRVVARLVATLSTVDGELTDLSTMHTRFRTYVARELGPPRNRIALVASAFNASETSIYAWRREALKRQDNRKTDRDWLLEYIRSQGPGPVRRDRIEAHFMKMATDEAPESIAQTTMASIRGRFETALWLLRKADIVFATSSGDPLFFAPELPDTLEARARMLWLEIFERSSITPIARSELLELGALDALELERALAFLVEERRIERADSSDPEDPCFRSTELYLPFDDKEQEHSLEVATLDHLRLVIDTLIDRFEHRSVRTGRAPDTLKAEREALREAFDAKSGMVSWRYDLWPGHPFEQEILELGEKLVELGHRVSVDARVLEGSRTAERVVYVGMHTRAATPRPEAREDADDS